jgi:hypothetical protein
VAAIDARGRLFGRFNLVDTLVIGMVLLLVPLGYATYLLFRPATPRIDSVTQSEITREELRLAGGSVIAAKLKVRGSGLNPMLRASIGDTPAMGFVFESPMSADVILGPVPPGTHDLILFDGVQEVARARDAVTIEALTPTAVRLAGRFIDLEPASADALTVTPEEARAGANLVVIALGPTEQGRERISVGERLVDVAVRDRAEREAVVDVYCDPRRDVDACTVGGVRLSSPAPVVVPLVIANQVLRFAVSDVLPRAAPSPVTLRVRFAGGAELDHIAAGDRDRLLDERAATVQSVVRRNNITEVTFRLGADPSREGWRYRGQLLAPGAPFHLTTMTYALAGTIESMAPPRPNGEDHTP